MPARRKRSNPIWNTVLKTLNLNTILLAVIGYLATDIKGTSDKVSSTQDTTIKVYDSTAIRQSSWRRRSDSVFTIVFNRFDSINYRLEHLTLMVEKLSSDTTKSN